VHLLNTNNFRVNNFLISFLFATNENFLEPNNVFLLYGINRTSEIAVTRYVRWS